MRTSPFVVLLSHGREAFVVTSFARLTSEYNVIAAKIRQRAYGNFKPHRFWISFDIQHGAVETRFAVQFDPNASCLDFQNLYRTIIGEHYFQACLAPFPDKEFGSSMLGDVLPRSKRAKVLTKSFPKFIPGCVVLDYEREVEERPILWANATECGMSAFLHSSQVLCRNLSIVSRSSGDSDVNVPGLPEEIQDLGQVEDYPKLKTQL